MMESMKAGTARAIRAAGVRTAAGGAESIEREEKDAFIYCHYIVGGDAKASDKDDA